MVLIITQIIAHREFHSPILMSIFETDILHIEEEERRKDGDHLIIEAIHYRYPISNNIIHIHF